MVKIQTEVVNGECPTCSELTMLVGLTPELFRCMNCGSDLEQHVNGKITYLPIMSTRNDGGVPFVKEWTCLLYTSPSPRDRQKSRMPSSA